MKKETYTLSDFGTESWMDRSEYSSCQGICLNYVRSLHEGSDVYFSTPDEFEFVNHVFFVNVDKSRKFEIWTYNIISWGCDNKPIAVLPTFLVFGRTWEGITEVQASPVTMPMPDGIIEQMKWVNNFCGLKGWA